jgi:hypothetical protein
MNLKLVTASVAAGAMLFALGASVRGGGSAPAGLRAPGAARRATAQALTHGYYAPNAPLHRRPVAGPNGVIDAFSFNWSGYAATGGVGAFTKVSASWTVPKLTACTGEHTTNSEWIGFDGFTNGTVEQDGTDAQCYLGKVSYVDWYEMWPTEPDIVAVKNVTPGDKINASVTRSVTRNGSVYKLVVVDATHRKDSFTVTTTCARTMCENDSVEWISERNDFGAPNGYSPLSDYRTWRVTNGVATKRGRSLRIGSLPGLNNVGMFDATGVYNLSTASALTRGNTFTTTWRDSW